MNYLFQSIPFPDTAPWIYFVLVGLSFFAGSLGIPKIIQIYKDDKCEKRINKIKNAVTGSMTGMHIMVAILKEEFPDKPALKSGIERVEKLLNDTEKLLNED